MEISSNSLNQPVNFYNKNTGNNINMAIEGENHLYQSNIFASEFGIKKIERNSSAPNRKKRKSKRLNTIDTDYLPDEAEVQEEKFQNENIFLENEQNSLIKRLKKSIDYFLTSMPLINYFFLKEREQKIKKTVEKLNDINQNIDELLNTAAPFGEEDTIYQNIAENLTNAANILGKDKKNMPN